MEYYKIKKKDASLSAFISNFVYRNSYFVIRN